MSELFNAGQRPAIDSGLSVSRVGSAAQFKAMKQVSGSLKIELASYHELQAFSQFGSDLDAETKKVLNHGDHLMEVLKQDQYSPYSMNRQIIDLFTVKNYLLEDIAIKDVKPLLDALYTHMENNEKKILGELTEKKQISSELEGKMKEAITKFIENYKLTLK